MNNEESFAVLILTHKRADNVITYNVLKDSGYTGPILLVIDNEDDQADLYYKKYPNEVVMFNKKEIANTTDEGDNFNKRQTITHARNVAFKIAKERGYKYFIQLDDDYQIIAYKFDEKLNFKHNKIKSLDKIFKILVNYLKKTKAKSVAMAQGGDFIGGEKGAFAKKFTVKRKCMNTFICDVDNPIKFIGRLNEDVCTYITYGSRGDLFLTIPNCYVTPKATQSQKGGITEAYLEAGTYVKSFYSVMFNPSSIKVSLMGSKYKRLHHKITWKNAVPVILNEKYKK